MSRRLAREIALQVLFQVDVNKETDDVGKAIETWSAEFCVPEPSVVFARQLIDGTLEHKEEIDNKIAALAEGWALTRMPNVDRNLLRLAAYEIFYRPDIPGRVTMNEAIEMAKRFGGEDSAKFINGILDRFVAKVGKDEENSTKPVGETIKIEAKPAEAKDGTKI